MHPVWPWLWAVLLVGSLLAVIGFARAGSVVFWKCEAERGEPEPRRQDETPQPCAQPAPGRGPRPARPVRGPGHDRHGRHRQQLFNPALYIEAVLGSGTQLAGR